MDLASKKNRVAQKGPALIYVYSWIQPQHRKIGLHVPRCAIMEHGPNRYQDLYLNITLQKEHQDMDKEEHFHSSTMIH